MREIASLSAPTTVIIGTRGLSTKHGPFASEENDGLVALLEVTAPWASDEVRLPVIHTFLPSSRRVSAVILQRLADMPMAPTQA